MWHQSFRSRDGLQHRSSQRVLAAGQVGGAPPSVHRTWVTSLRRVWLTVRQDRSPYTASLMNDFVPQSHRARQQVRRSARSTDRAVQRVGGRSDIGRAFPAVSWSPGTSTSRYRIGHALSGVIELHMVARYG